DGEVPAADGAEACDVGEDETGLREGMRIQIFRFDRGQGDDHHKHREGDGAVAYLQDDEEPVDLLLGWQFFAGGWRGRAGVIGNDGWFHDQGTGTTEVTSGTRSRRLRSIPICKVIVLLGQP